MQVSIKSDQIVEIRDAAGNLCGIYHYEDPFKSFFRGLYTPGGKDVVALPPPEYPHHKGLQFGLCTSLANFWEEDEANVPPGNILPFGKQQTTNLKLMPPDVGMGFTQEILWATGNESVFNETRSISMEEKQGAYVWTWQTTLTAAREVQIINSVWGVPSYCVPLFSYCGLGLRLARDLFENGEVLPTGVECGKPPAYVSFRGKGAEVTFKQDYGPANALFVTTYEQAPPYGPDGPGFAFMGLVPSSYEFKPIFAVISSSQTSSNSFLISSSGL